MHIIHEMEQNDESVKFFTLVDLFNFLIKKMRKNGIASIINVDE